MWAEWKHKSLGRIFTDAARRWWRSLDTPNPWSDELDDAVRAPDAIPVCHRCTTPCEFPVWFCPTCGAAVGPYNNILPFVRIYSVGEALRSGVGPEAHFTPFRTMAYVCVGLMEYQVFAPVYFVRLFLNCRRMRKHEHESPMPSRGAATPPLDTASSRKPPSLNRLQRIPDGC